VSLEWLFVLDRVDVLLANLDSPMLARRDVFRLPSGWSKPRLANDPRLTDVIARSAPRLRTPTRFRS
jgi:hypothetical protein